MIYVLTLGQMGLRYDDRPVSRATDVTDMPDRGTANASPSGADTLRSAVDSEVPLQGSPESAIRQRPANLDLSHTFKNTSAQNSKNSPRSPMSFRSSFIMANRNSRNSLPRRLEGHEKLESDPPTPHTITKEETKEQVKRELGKNYEYFTGNTRFFLGGRWQNARELPINVGTGLAILIPAILFFVFS
jgi:palmitoyltransferase ZDHHC9/14/18